MTISERRRDSGRACRARAARRAGPRCGRSRCPSCSRRQRITGQQESVVGGVGGRPRRSRGAGMRRRPGCRAAAHVIVVTGDDPAPATWAAAIEVGARHVLRLPAQEHDLVRELADAGEVSARRRQSRRGGSGYRRVRRGGRVTVRGRTGAARPTMRCWSMSIPGPAASICWSAPRPARCALAGSGVAGRTAELVGGARSVAAASRDQHAVGHAARP